MEDLSWMVDSRSLNEEGLLVLEIGPQRPGGFTPSSCWISLALLNGKHELYGILNEGQYLLEYNLLPLAEPS